MFGRSQDNCFVHTKRGVDVTKHHGRRAVGNERTIGALERAGHIGILFTWGPAELVSKIFAHLSETVADAIFVILCRNSRERLGLITKLLEIQPSDLAKNAG